jgi:2,5-diketo-D-gluconate reductase A
MAPSGRADRRSKSIHQDRIAANFDAFDFELGAADLELIRGMDASDGRTGANPATAAFLF